MIFFLRIFSSSRSVILPMPSSPHWAPMITIPAISAGSLRGGAPHPGLAVGGLGLPRGRPGGEIRLPRLVADLRPAVVAGHRLRLAADLVQARDGAAAGPP